MSGLCWSIEGRLAFTATEYRIDGALSFWDIDRYCTVQYRQDQAPGLLTAGVDGVGSGVNKPASNLTDKAQEERRVVHPIIRSIILQLTHKHNYEINRRSLEVHPGPIQYSTITYITHLRPGPRSQTRQAKSRFMYFRELCYGSWDHSSVASSNDTTTKFYNISLSLEGRIRATLDKLVWWSLIILVRGGLYCEAYSNGLLIQHARGTSPRHYIFLSRCSRGQKSYEGWEDSLFKLFQLANFLFPSFILYLWRRRGASSPLSIKSTFSPFRQQHPPTLQQGSHPGFLSGRCWAFCRFS